MVDTVECVQWWELDGTSSIFTAAASLNVLTSRHEDNQPDTARAAD